MKIKIRPFLGALSVAGLLIFSPGLALAQSTAATSSASTANKTDTRINKIKARGDAEIERRLTSLNNALNRLSSAKHISDSDKQTLTNNIQTDITNLTSLKTKIDADTDLATLKNDVQGIVKDYRVYLVFLPQTRISAAGDSISTVVEKLNTLSENLNSRIEEDSAAGKDTSTLQSLLNDLNAKVADAQSQATAAEQEVLPLTPQGYPGNGSTLKDARSKIKVGVSDLKAARSDAVQITVGLKKLEG